MIPANIAPVKVAAHRLVPTQCVRRRILNSDPTGVVKGCVAENTYITLEPEALDAIKLEREPYYIPPGDKYAAESYAVLQAP